MAETGQPAAERKSAGKIAFLFKRGREARQAASGPTEFFYGLVQLQAAGYDARIITDREFDLETPPGRLWRALSQLAFAGFGLPLWPLARLARQDARARLGTFDHIVVTTNIFGVCLGVLRRLHLIRPNVLFIAMGLVGPATRPGVIAAYRWIFGKGAVLRTLSEVDARLLSVKLAIPVAHIPFGVDDAFWVPADSAAPAASGSYVLSIGNDAHRDYRTLLDAWKPEYPMLRIVTGHDIASNRANVEILKGDWHRQVLSDEQIRALIQGAQFVVLPIGHTFQPSGQSACLQAMACAKAVVITDFPGLWNREMLRDGETCVLAGPPGDRVGLQNAVERLIRDPALASATGRRARKLVETDLNVGKMALAIGADLDRLAVDRMDRS